MKLYLITIEISEAATKHAYPIVTHEFLGRTKKEALGYHHSHLKTDKFLRDCEAKGKMGAVACRAVVTFSGWVTR